MTSMTDIGGAITFTYDDWGRTVSKYRGSLGAAYAYKYGGKLSKVTSTMYDEGTVEYNYRADGKRHTRTAGILTWTFEWGAGWNVVSEMLGSGLSRTYIGGMAHVDGTSPSSGAYSYYMHDNLGSTRALYDQSKVLTDSFEYDPYGGAYLTSNGSLVDHLYTGHQWDAKSQLYFAPYRYYSAAAARWMSRDPLGMVDGVNFYAYAGGSPVQYLDSKGTRSTDSLSKRLEEINLQYQIKKIEILQDYSMERAACIAPCWDTNLTLFELGAGAVLSSLALAAVPAGITQVLAAIVGFGGGVLIGASLAGFLFGCEILCMKNTRLAIRKRNLRNRLNELWLKTELEVAFSEFLGIDTRNISRIGMGDV
jgi:RHS repeat-associated protein